MWAAASCTGSTPKRPRTSSAECRKPVHPSLSAACTGKAQSMEFIWTIKRDWKSSKSRLFISNQTHPFISHLTTTTLCMWCSNLSITASGASRQGHCPSARVAATFSSDVPRHKTAASITVRHLRLQNLWQSQDSCSPTQRKSLLTGQQSLNRTVIQLQWLTNTAYEEPSVNFAFCDRNTTGWETQSATQKEQTATFFWSPLSDSYCHLGRAHNYTYNT